MEAQSHQKKKMPAGGGEPTGGLYLDLSSAVRQHPETWQPERGFGCSISLTRAMHTSLKFTESEVFLWQQKRDSLRG